MPGKIGILALQGGFDLHRKKVVSLGATPVLIKQREALGGLDGLIIPGGESSVLLHLTDTPFREEIRRRALDGLPVLGTCAGLIFIAESVENPEQESLKLLGITVRRNAYGRQVDSFIAQDLPWGPSGRERLPEAVFIRAPKIVSLSPEVTPLVKHHGDAILVQQGTITGATFHPELSQHSDIVYRHAFPKVFG